MGIPPITNRVILETLPNTILFIYLFIYLAFLTSRVLKRNAHSQVEVSWGSILGIHPTKRRYYGHFPPDHHRTKIPDLRYVANRSYPSNYRQKTGGQIG